ncbi:MAG: hypothetical protein P8186_14380 [Anaerolineae bacterium]
MQTRVGIALGIVFLMTVKPDLGRSLLTLPMAVRERGPEELPQ